MSKFTINEIIDYTEKWLLTGELKPEILSDNFHFISPFWESNDKNTFISKFLDPKEYFEKSLSNILRFDPIIKLKSDDEKHFTIVLEYHTKYGVSVDEAVLGTIANGLLVELKSIYDLEKTKKAHKL
ncbi:MAG: hypothetical protein COY58_01650 [Gammaproteobacteria bacterium CG_4_10_14_0_8_um_filter_38_16]|nr:MAG: hypothetical protein COY58_01650 [Gammaproteobacteria bacterium CG_4_10_14_0_8_um_filter_38_16]PJA04263.1 MAG: hypothetical protein COX72_00940 [Gammaproteobacteria bacterium CG_4_10_14_0_2_um_filter_38_22]PJB09693.1 MAG: hypothetical protein CO120_08735 [Gammaproteobacteria bacterium CG_4_9_14_3_um_filter_38_9]